MRVQGATNRPAVKAVMHGIALIANRTVTLWLR
jgi:hypothetical protein